MHPHSDNVQSSKDAQEQATLHLKNARKSLGAILVLAHQPTDDTDQCAPENQRSQGQDQGVAQARPLALGKASSNSRAPDTGSDKVTTAAAHHATPKQILASNTSTHTHKGRVWHDRLCLSWDGAKPIRDMRSGRMHAYPGDWQDKVQY